MFPDLLFTYNIVSINIKTQWNSEKILCILLLNFSFRFILVDAFKTEILYQVV